MGNSICCNNATNDQMPDMDQFDRKRLKLSKSKADSMMSNTYEEALVFSEVIMTGKP